MNLKQNLSPMFGRWVRNNSQENMIVGNLDYTLRLLDLYDRARITDRRIVFTYQPRWEQGRDLTLTEKNLLYQHTLDYIRSKETIISIRKSRGLPNKPITLDDIAQALQQGTKAVELQSQPKALVA